MPTVVMPAVTKSQKHVAAGPGHDHGHHEPSFIRKYLFSTDHKTIGIQFMVSSTLFLLIGGALAMVVRFQLGWPQQPFGFLAGLPENWITKTTGGAYFSDGF